MACPYPRGDPVTWCTWHRHAEELIREMEASAASAAIRVVRGERATLAARKA